MELQQQEKPMNRIRELRKRKGWSQFQLAMKFKEPIHPNVIAYWENGGMPSAKNLLELAEIFEVDPKELICG
jgi:transcriptional regulator with XRE-family HTH domain